MATDTAATTAPEKAGEEAPPLFLDSREFNHLEIRFFSHLFLEKFIIKNSEQLHLLAADRRRTAVSVRSSQGYLRTEEDGQSPLLSSIGPDVLYLFNVLHFFHANL